MNDKCSNGFCEFDSHTTTKIINMKKEKHGYTYPTTKN